MKNIFTILLCFFIAKGYSQTYNPINAIPTNKPIGISQATSTDARSMFYDATNFLYRPYNGTAEVLTYLNLVKYRIGGFDIIVNIGGSLQSNGTFIGGKNYAYWFKDSTADANLVLKYVFTGTSSQSVRGDGSIGPFPDSTLAGTGLQKSGNIIGIVPTGVIAGPYSIPTYQVNLQGQLVKSAPGLMNTLGNGTASFFTSTRSVSSLTVTDFNTRNFHDTTYLSWHVLADGSLMGLIDTAGLHSAFGGGGGGGGVWGSITGTLSAQTDLQTALNGKLSTTLTSANMYVGNGSNVATAFVPTGDWTITNAGVSTISNNAITTVKVTANAITYPKIQQVNASRLTGNPTGSAANMSEIPLGFGVRFNSDLEADTAALRTWLGTFPQDTLANPIGFADSILMHPSTHRFLLRALVAGSLTNITPTDTTLTIGLANNTANTLLGFNGSGVPSDITLTTTGSSGPATISGGVLNIPQYSGGSVTSVTQSTDTLKYNNGSDHVVNINRNFLGSIYNKNTWSNLSDFNVNGAFAFIVSNKIHFSAGAGNYSHILELTSPYTGVNIERWKMVMKIKVDTVNGSTFGAGCGMNSINGYGKNSVVGRTSLTSTPSSNGQAMLDNASNGTSFVNLNTSDVSTNIPIAAGDYVYVIVERDINVITVSVKDITTNSRYNFTSYSYPSNTTPYVPNTGRFSLWDFGGGWTLDSLAITSTAEKFVENAAVGDSKTQCFNASSFNLRWSSLLNQYVPTITLAGGFDRTAEVLLDIPLIIALHPKQVILSIGSNDVRSGVSTATYLANYDTITNRLTAAGITVYHTVNWESSVDLTTLWTHVTATYPNNYIDTWYPLQTPGDISGDGVHPTDTGHAVIANQVLNYFHLYGVLPPLQPSSGTPVTGSGTTNFLSKFSSANGITNSSVTDDGSKVTITDPALEIAASATAGTTWNRTGGPTNEKIWDQYTDGTNLYNRVINDARGASTIWQQVVRSGTSITSITLPSGSFNVTNATNLTGALTTSTSITSNATAFIPVHFNSTSSNGSGFDFQRSGTTKAYIGSGVSGGTGGSTADDLGIRANNIFLSDLTNGNSKISFDALNGKAHIGSTTDQGAFTLQNTGGLYQNGTFSLRGTLSAPSNTLPLLVKGTDSVVYQLSQSSFLTANNISSGTYTPTLTNTTNVASSTAFQCQYLQVGLVVTVSGEVTIDPTLTTTLTLLDMSLPISTTFAASTNCGGTAVSQSIGEAPIQIEAHSSGSTVVFRWVCTDTGAQTIFFHFTYSLAGS